MTSLKRGMVPCNYVERVPQEDFEAATKQADEQQQQQQDRAQPAADDDKKKKKKKKGVLKKVFGKKK